MADTEPLAQWERELLDQQARDAALRAGRAILDAYHRGVLHIDAGYLADTLRMVLEAVPPVKGDA